MNQKIRINKLINESMLKFEQLCPKDYVEQGPTGKLRYWLEIISDEHNRLKRKAKQDAHQLIFRIDSRCGFAVHRILRKRLAGKLNDVSSNRRLRSCTTFWRSILVDHIRNSGVSIRTSYIADSGPFQCIDGVIRVAPYLTETQLLKALLNAFSHQILHFDTGRATSRRIRPTCLHHSEALALCYVVSRCIGLESLFHDDIRAWNRLAADEIDWHFRRRIRSAAFVLLESLDSHDHFRKGNRESV